jgi:large subunit GTPase 1
MVGYPNVGKSSTVNALVAAKKTGVSATPGGAVHVDSP